MSTEQSLVLIGVGWVLAAATLLYVGYWIGGTNRYDHCVVAEMNQQPVRICPFGEYETPTAPRGEA